MSLWKILVVIFATNLAYNSFGAIEKEKICFIGDSGTDTEKPKKVARAMEEVGCTQVHVAGDIIYENGLNSAEDPAFYSKFYDHYKFLIAKNIPFYVVMGNHDARGNTDSWLELAKKFNWLHFPNHYYMVNQEGVCFTYIDTNQSKIVGKKQVNWAAQNLDFLREQGLCQFSIAVGHHPYLSVGLHGDANVLVKKFLKKSIMGKVDLYVAGHDHNLSDEGVVKGTRLLVSGSAAKLRPLARAAREGGYAESVLGFIALEFSRIDGKLVGTYKLYGLDDNDVVSVRYSQSIIGSGIR